MGQFPTIKDYRLRTVGLCPTCGVEISRHAVCGACCVLTGPGHTQATGGLCGGCWRQSQMPEGAEMVETAIRRNNVA